MGAQKKTHWQQSSMETLISVRESNNKQFPLLPMIKSKTVFKGCKLLANFNSSQKKRFHGKFRYKGHISFEINPIGLAKKVPKNRRFSRPTATTFLMMATNTTQDEEEVPLAGGCVATDRKTSTKMGGISETGKVYSKLKMHGFSAFPPRLAWFNAFNSFNDVIF